MFIHHFKRCPILVISKTLELNPDVVKQGNKIIVEGLNWCNCPIKIKIDNDSVKNIRIVKGFPVSEGVLPDPTGSFCIIISTLGMKPGKHRLIATSIHETNKKSLSSQFEVKERPLYRSDGRLADKPFRRTLESFNRSYAHIGFIPQGVRETQISEIRTLRQNEYNLYSVPVTGICNWTPVGAGPLPNGTDEGKYPALSGRVAAIAIDPINPNIIYIGTAIGGVWKSIDSGHTWSPKTDYQMNLAIGAIAIDPFDTSRIFAGTGGYDMTGNGILLSEDGGNKWLELATDIFERVSISRIIFDITDPTSKRMFLACEYGVYESVDSGSNWNVLQPGDARDLVMIVESTGKLKTIKLIAACYGTGLWSSTGELKKTGYKWSKWTQYTSVDVPMYFGNIALGQSKNNPKNVFAIYETDSKIGAILKTSDGGKIWKSVSIRLNDTPAGADNPPESSNVLGHTHKLISIPKADMIAVPTSHSYTTTSGGMPMHTHKITLSAKEIEQLAKGNVVNKDTDVDSSRHRHNFNLGMWIDQAWYNLHIAVHPDDPKIVYFGEIRLWKTTEGGGIFNDITSGPPVTSPSEGTPYAIHVDQHCFAFDPKDSNKIWSGNDGGIYCSADGGKKWIHRNRDLATFQYVTISLHSKWETIMLGGTQDNGLHRYTGTPAWEFSRGGDAGFTAIDPRTVYPGDPVIMYHGYIQNWVLRSDKGGEKLSWYNKTGGITGASLWYPPFILDPSNPDTCYFGNEKLWRFDKKADEWYAITGLLKGLISSIAVHPTDPTTIYIGTDIGNVYRLRKTTSWDLSKIIIDDLTKPPLPAGVTISDIAIDSSGTVWATVSSLLRDSSGIFINDYVYCLQNTGLDVWESRSTGLVKANPIHSIVIDPSNRNRLFCGGDVGIFRTEDGGLKWSVWDQGLPNVQVKDLVIHEPRRLLRAATYGRSVWERPIDAGVCPPVDLYIRDNILDSGRVQPSPTDQPHPFNPSINVYWWQSPDIKVDSPEPEFQTSDPIDDYVAYESDLIHRNARRNSENRFYVQLHNRGPKKATNVQVRAFFTSASAGLPKLPSDFWSGGSPFKKDPSAVDWIPIGPTKKISELEPGEPGVVQWNWMVPTTAPAHSCLLVLITCKEDPLKITDVYDTGRLVRDSKHAALKNLHVLNPWLGLTTPDFTHIIEFHHPERHEGLVDLIFNWGNVPQNTKVFVVFESLQNNENSVKANTETLKKNGVTVQQNSKVKVLFREKLEYGCGQLKHFNLNYIYQLRVLENRPKQTIIPSVKIPEGRPLLMAINLTLPRVVEEEKIQFDVIQCAGQQTIGGSTYLLLPRKE